jgi:hypothetical protein
MIFRGGRRGSRLITVVISLAARLFPVGLANIRDFSLNPLNKHNKLLLS